MHARRRQRRRETLFLRGISGRGALSPVLFFFFTVDVLGLLFIISLGWEMT